MALPNFRGETQETYVAAVDANHTDNANQSKKYLMRQSAEPKTVNSVLGTDKVTRSVRRERYPTTVSAARTHTSLSTFRAVRGSPYTARRRPGPLVPTTVIRRRVVLFAVFSFSRPSFDFPDVLPQV